MCVGLRLFERTTTAYTLSRIYKMNRKILGGHNSVVGIATRYGVDGPGIESPEGGGETFRTAYTGADAYAVIRTMGTVSFPGVMRPERVAHYPPTSSARLRMGVMG
jgi:hypothetical protein